jgi:hypothetical protein
MEKPGNYFDDMCDDESLKALERIALEDPLPIFEGAILCSGNNLLTSQHKIIELFWAMQDGELSYPESMRPKIENVHITQGTTLRSSKEVELLFNRIGESLGIIWDWEQSSNNRNFIGERYRMTDDAIAEFLEIWGNDYEALEFYQRCADFLAE